MRCRWYGDRTRGRRPRRPGYAAGRGEPKVLLLRLGLLATALVLALGALPGRVVAQEPSPPELVLADGTSLRVEPDPFRLVLTGAEGEIVATVAGTSQGVEADVDGPHPVGPSGAFPALGWVVGARQDGTFPASFFQGNRLYGAEAGGVVSVVAAATSVAAGTLAADLVVDVPGVGTGTLTATPLPEGGVRVDVTPPPGLPNVISTLLTLASPSDEGLFGLGARKDAFDQRGTLRNVWTEQQNSGQGPLAPVTSPLVGSDYTFPNGGQGAYYVQALLFGSRGWGVWSDDSELNRLDLAATRDDQVRWAIQSAEVTWSFAGGGLEQASTAYTGDTGRAPAPPRWVYTNWVDVLNEGEGDAAPNGARFDGGARVEADALEIASRAEDLDVPIEVIGLEGWHTIPDVESFVTELRRRGFRLSAYWNMFTAPESGQPYERALEEGLFVTDRATGEPYPVVTNRGNRSYLIDFTHPASVDYWADQIRRSAELGFEGFMHDFGELITEPMAFHSGQPAETVHNRYPVLYHRAARLAVDQLAQELPGHEPFFYVRAGYSGYEGQDAVQASTPGVFPGDETTDWDEGSGLPSIIPAMLNLSLGGVYAYTTDVGGYLDLYTPQTSAELLTRWHQAAVFTPMSRIHNSTQNGSVHPWDFDERTLDTYRRYARANLRLKDLKHEWAQRAATTGTIGPVRPLVLVDPSPEARREDQWLLGDDILVAPVVEQGATSRDVYLPAGGRWERVTVGPDGRFLRTGEVFDGGQTLTDVPAPYEDIPIFLRASAAQDPPPSAPSERPVTPATGGSGQRALGVVVLLLAAALSGPAGRRRGREPGRRWRMRTRGTRRRGLGWG